MAAGMRRPLVTAADIEVDGNRNRRTAVCRSDAGVPGVAALGSRRTQALAERFHAIGNGEARDVFDALVPELPGNTKPQRSTEADRQFTAVHAMGDKSLRVQRIRHVDACPPV